MPIAQSAGKRIPVLAAIVSTALLLVLVALIAENAQAIGLAGQWVSMGEIPAGRATAAQATPFYASSRNVFFASDTGGVYRSIDGGDTFQERNSGLLDQRVTNLAVSPRFEFDLLLFASTPTGLFRSGDGAANWSRATSGLPDSGVTGVAFAPAFEANQTVFAATDGFGVYRSNDAGTTWNSLSSSGLTRTDLKGIQVAPGAGGHLTMVVWTDSHVFRSRDSGSTWKERNSGLPGGRSIRFIALGPKFDADGLALLGTKGHGIYRTKNRGDNWSSAGLSGKGAVEAVIFAPAFGADGGILVYAGTTEGGFFRSTDRGRSWKESNKGLPRNSIASISISNDFRSDETLFAGGAHGGLFRSTNAGDTWAAIGSGIVTARVAALGFSNNYRSDRTLFIGTQSGLLKSEDHGVTWSNITWNLPDRRIQTMAVSPSYADERAIFVGLHGDGVHRTFREAGNAWVKQDAGLKGSRLEANPLTVATSPAFHNTRGDLTVFVGGSGGVARSELAGTAWVHVLGVAPGAAISSIAPSPAYDSDGTVFAASRGSGVFKSMTRGQSWDLVNNGLGNLMVHQLAISPSFTSDRTVLAATDGGVFITRDGGQVWSATSVTQAVSTVAFAPDFPASRAAFTSSAGQGGVVMQSVDGGVNWHPITNGLPNAEILVLGVSPDFANDKNVFVGTDRYGLWVYWATGGITGPVTTPVVTTPVTETPVPPTRPVTVVPSSIGAATVVSNLYVVDPSGANADLRHNVPNLAVVVDGQTLVAEFKRHYESTGGIERWGLPISEVFEETSGSLTQYYQRGVVDFHKRLDLGGTWVTERRLTWDYMGGGAGGSVDMGVEPHITNPHEGQPLGPWGHKVSDFDISGQFVGFRQFFDRFGGTHSFGYPKTDARADIGAPGMLLARGASLGRVRQYYQAAIMEFFPDNPEGYKVQLTLLGDFLRDLTYPNESWRNLAPFSAAQEFAAGSTVGIVAVR
ncbi:MAG: hypothetical protein OXG46_08450 [Chloroflexi bacterium]|nr:hypothetical protein [Chloroflexota bacterium]MCY3937456.1 hypothetical protein [Chloroflexota bacterium]